ncbi:MAG: hypothetical protein USCAAHI_01767 [Beijerinckiaceae bacterium]|jgi:hypothetical protein|nr:MAG: hypothetical protein USCAAHI_01767 [Beijerinckiaceae bacterium]
MRGFVAVRGSVLEQHVGGNLSQFESNGDDDNSGNDGRKQFSRPVDEGRHRDLTGACKDHHAADGRQAERRGRRYARR